MGDEVENPAMASTSPALMAYSVRFQWWDGLGGALRFRLLGTTTSGYSVEAGLQLLPV